MFDTFLSLRSSYSSWISTVYFSSFYITSYTYYFIFWIVSLEYCWLRSFKKRWNCVSCVKILKKAFWRAVVHMPINHCALRIVVMWQCLPSTNNNSIFFSTSLAIGRQSSKIITWQGLRSQYFTNFRSSSSQDAYRKLLRNFHLFCFMSAILYDVESSSLILYKKLSSFSITHFLIAVNICAFFIMSCTQFCTMSLSHPTSNTLISCSFWPFGSIQFQGIIFENDSALPQLQVTKYMKDTLSAMSYSMCLIIVVFPDLLPPTIIDGEFNSAKKDIFFTIKIRI